MDGYHPTAVFFEGFLDVQCSLGSQGLDFCFDCVVLIHQRHVEGGWFS